MNTRDASLAIALYIIAWGGPRFEAISCNVLLLDDYYIGASDRDQPNKGNERLYLRSYRPLLFAEYRFWEWVVPGHFMTSLPKYAAGGYLVAASLATCVLLSRW